MKIIRVVVKIDSCCKIEDVEEYFEFEESVSDVEIDRIVKGWTNKKYYNIFQ